MNLRIFRKLLFLSGIVFCGSLSAQKVWSLKECIDYAVANNLQIKQNQLNADLNKVKRDQSAAQLLPSVNGNASHTYNYGRTIDPFTNQFVDKRTLSQNFSATSNMPLFEGFSLQNQLRQNNYEYLASKSDVEKVKNDISLNVCTAYLQVLYNQELLLTSKSQLEASQTQVDRTKRLVESGSLPRGSLLDAEAQAATEELRVVTAQNQLDISYLTLTQLLDLSSVSDFKVEDPKFAVPADLMLNSDPKSIYEYAVQNQPDIKSAEFRIKSAEKGLAAARGGRSPRLFINASLGTGYSDIRERLQSASLVQVPIGITASGEQVFSAQLVPVYEKTPFRAQLDENLFKSIGFNLTIPIFNGWQVKSNINRSIINLKNAELSSQLSKNQLNKTIQQAYLDANASYKKLKATEKTLESLKEALKYTEQKFNVGLLASIDYITAKNNLNRSEADLLQAKYDFIFKTKVLDFYLGKPLAF